MEGRKRRGEKGREGNRRGKGEEKGEMEMKVG